VTVANVVDSDGRSPSSSVGGRYVLAQALGRGASAETFAARDATTGETVVVKLFARESRATATEEFRQLLGVGHPSVVRVRDIGRTADGRPFVVTQHVAGPPLDSVASVAGDAERRRAFERAAEALADALAHLHGRGVIHGDVCPANVRLDPGGRAVLLDFGLAGPATPGGGGARGTLGYAAPEALGGARTPGSDLFALGATLFAAWTGTAPFGSGLAAVQRMLTGRAPALSSVRPGLPEAWDRILDRLLAPDPRERTPSARQLLREIRRASAGADAPAELDLGVPYPEGDPLEGLFVGRAAEREALRGAFERVADGAASHSVVVVAGAPGSGRSTLIDAAAREAAVAVAAGVLHDVEVVRGDVRALEALAGVVPTSSPEADGDAARGLQRRLATLVEALERRAAARPLAAIMPGGSLTEALAAAVASTPPSGRLLLVAPALEPLERPFATHLAIGPLGPDDVAALVTRALAGEEAPGQAVAAIVETARGHAALVTILARRLVDAVRAGADGAEAVRSLATPGADLDAVLGPELDALDLDAGRAAVGVALAGAEGAALAGPDATGAPLARARAAGWVRRGADDALEPASDAHRRVALAALTRPAFAALVARAAEGLPADDPRRATALAAAGRVPEAVALWRALAVRADGEGDGARAAAWLEEVARTAPAVLTAREHVMRASGLGALGRYPAAMAAVEQARGASRSDAERLLVIERRAWLLARTGDLATAAAELSAALVSGAAAAGEALAPLRARLGRLLVTMGRFDDALATLEPLLGSRATSVAAVPVHAIEAAILARAYRGDTGAARALLDSAAGAGAIGAGKRAYLEGLLAQLEGDVVAARESYRRAYEASSAAGEVHTLAAVALNLGGLLAEQGIFAEALATTERAVRALGQLGSTSELGTALVNAANLLVQLGDPSGARRALDRARTESAARGTAVARALVAFVEGDLARREGRLGEASAAYTEAEARFLESGQGRRAASATLARAEALALAGRPSDAAAALIGARETLDADTPDIELAQAEARLALCRAEVGEADGPLARRAFAIAREAGARGSRPAAWRLSVTAARLAARAGDAPTARAAQIFARDLFQEIRMASPEHHRPGLDADPDAPWLTALGAATPPTSDVALAARAAATESRLRRLLRINKRLNSELRLPRLLETIVDTVIELCDAERGFLLLEDESGELVVKVARNIDQKTLETAEFELSRSIARQAAAGGEPIVTIDAAGDTRFREALSVSDLHLRSVLAVPLVVKGRAVGTIYADHRLRKGAFDDEDVKVVLDFAEQAAIAIENARLLSELRRRERQVEALNRRLEVELAARGEELSGMKQELRENREALAVRYDYRNLVGRTPRMLELFRLLDRLTDTALPVVIQGESGTGKELVARAIHFNGPRKDRPFVSENCAAIPETLLESTLFGYARGAFTGAERDTRGLFEVADGGTLFLDEVGEMSPAMQGKLLRVLQEGELRRVGAERTRKIDVRVVVATNRDLQRMVEEGKFRQDLFFRLAVARIALPPLRERREDIPLIVEHLLAKRAREAAGGDAKATPKPLDAPALARLVAYRWPGNVRELENELTRAYALSGDRITLADLSPAVAAAGDAESVAPTDFDSLLLKPRVERLERSLLREALGRSGNNQTKAAELLGLSRFGLQKKLKRYRFA
jgi:transcriptional regulator with GAF, ATPase, and Fis domain/Tfp pilus assembly protein PilF